MKDLQWFPPIPEPRTIFAPKAMGSVIVGDLSAAGYSSAASAFR
jgi:hypothetical protein